ncbi:MAG: ParA family protein [Planctomycetota bacterium]
MIRGPQILVCANQKGGVGKTTAATHTAAGFQRLGCRTGLLDLDPQRNAVLCSSQDLEPRKDRPAPQGWDCFSTKEGLDLLAPSDSPGGATLDRALAWGEAWDLVVIDCPPSLEGWTQAAIERASAILIPMQCEFLSLQGLASMLGRIGTLARDPWVRILPSMYEPEKELQRETLAEVERHFPDRLGRTWIPRDPAISEASSHGVSLFCHDPRAIGTLAYARLIRELHHGWS